VILNFKWPSSEASSLTYKSLRLSSEWPMLWHKGRCPTHWYQDQRSYMWYLKRYTSGVIPTYEVMSIKMQDSILCIIEKHTFYENWWQRGRDWYKYMKHARGIREMLDLDMDMDREEQHWRIEKDKKFLDKRSTQVGGASSWTWLFAFDMCIFMCLLALHTFLNLICMRVWYMLVIEVEWWFDN
jgi:hypothetical protein